MVSFFDVTNRLKYYKIFGRKKIVDLYSKNSSKHVVILTFAGAILSYPENNFFFKSRLSVTASTTRSAVVNASSGFRAIVNLAIDSWTNCSAAVGSSLNFFLATRWIL